MQKFDGFPEGSKLSRTAFPSLFFSDLLTKIDDLVELKVTLFCFWALQQKEGRYRYLRHADFVNDAGFCAGLRAAAPDAEPSDTLMTGLARALERGTLLCMEVALASGAETLYFVNSALGRAAVAQIKAGQWQVINEANDIEILPQRHNIYNLYKANIGTLTPMIAEHLKDAEKEYPLEWIHEAIRAAVENEKRNWRYISAILKRREKEGNGLTRRPDESNGQGYVSGKLADFIEQ